VIFSSEQRSHTTRTLMKNEWRMNDLETLKGILTQYVKRKDVLIEISLTFNTVSFPGKLCKLDIFKCHKYFCQL
jgi:hypothetical protein